MKQYREQLEKAKKEGINLNWSNKHHFIELSKEHKKLIKEEVFINSFNVEKLEYSVRESIVRNLNKSFDWNLKDAIKSLLSLRKSLEKSIYKK